MYLLAGLIDGITGMERAIADTVAIPIHIHRIAATILVYIDTVYPIHAIASRRTRPGAVGGSDRQYAGSRYTASAREQDKPHHTEEQQAWGQ